MLSNNLRMNSSNLEGYIVSNYSKLDLSLNSNITTLEGKMIGNISSIYTNIQQNSTNLEQHIKLNFTQADNNLQSNVSALTATNQQLKAQLDSLMYLTYTTESELLFTCDLAQYTFKQFNVQSVTNNVNTANFTNGFVFEQPLSNAFIDVLQIGAAFTLFKNQKQFTNMKISLNTISFASGTILTFATQVRIQQMSIISVDSTQLSVNSGEQLNIIQSSSTSCLINDLLLNLTFSPISQGGINLVHNQQNGNMSIKGYQIFGSFYSSQCVALGAQISLTSYISISAVIINPNVFTVGNQSSFILSQINNCKVKIQSIIIIIISGNQPNIITSISSNNITYMQFGGIVATINASYTQINGVTYNSFEQWQTQFTNNSGQLVGAIYFNSSILNIYKICLNLNISSNKCDSFGIVGLSEGSIYLHLSIIQYNTLNGTYNSFGTVGNITSTCLNATFSNLQIQMIMAFSVFGRVAAMNGIQKAQNWSVDSINIQNTTTSGQHAGVLLGYAMNNGSINNIVIMRSQVSVSVNNGTNACGGIVLSWAGPYKAILVFNNLLLVNSQVQADSQQTLEFTQTQVSMLGSIIGEMYQNSKVQVIQTSQSNTIIQSSPHLVANAGGIVGNVFEQFTIINSTQENCSIIINGNSFARAGGYIGEVAIGTVNQVIVIQNSQYNKFIMTVNAINYTYVSGFVGLLNPTTLQITNVTISNIIITSQGQVITAKLTVNYGVGSIITQNSVVSLGVNTINAITQQNCQFVSLVSQSGC
ncbi:Hypothetical_protein [Hexamita inflata]|uniref:Hypothetical_protein n=1 Tax=Hexamita inflata TaxID=28002 RepID=A0ABP1H3W0_9EUKA